MYIDGERYIVYQMENIKIRVLLKRAHLVKYFLSTVSSLTYKNYMRFPAPRVSPVQPVVSVKYLV